MIVPAATTDPCLLTVLCQRCGEPADVDQSTSDVICAFCGATNGRPPLGRQRPVRGQQDLARLMELAGAENMISALLAVRERSVCRWNARCEEASVAARLMGERGWCPVCRLHAGDLYFDVGCYGQHGQ